MPRKANSNIFTPTKLQHFLHSTKYFSTFLHKSYDFTNLETPLYIVLTHMPKADFGCHRIKHKHAYNGISSIFSPL